MSRLRSESRIRRWALAAVAAMVAALAPAGVAVAAAPAHYYLDCATGSDAAAGTSTATAWRTLAKLNSTTFQAGDAISIRAGTTCPGVLAPHGSGTGSAPIVLGRYGDGARPKVVSSGARATVYLHNVQGWELHDLDVSDTSTDSSVPRIGIYVLLEDFGIGQRFVVDNVYVHNIAGCDCTGPQLDTSGGIVFRAAGTTTPTGLAGVTVTNSTVSGVDGIGIATSSLWARRATYYPDGPGTQFVGITGVRIRSNQLSDLGGDGIVLQNAVDGVAESNRVSGFGLRATAFHAGIWAFNSDRPIMQFNEVSGGGGPYPTMAFDIDSGNNGVVYQYNYSHDNSGGFMLFCANPGTASTNHTIRYNVSYHDHSNATFGLGVVTFGCEVHTNVKIYGNVFSTEDPVLVSNLTTTAAAFINDIFVGAPTGSVINDQYGKYDHNVYYRVTKTPSTEKAAVIGDPAFAKSGAGTKAAFKLACGSPALRAGVAVAGDTGIDFYGLSRSSGAAPNIGAYQGACVPS